jgi:ribose transport system ATP-binding protein
LRARQSSRPLGEQSGRGQVREAVGALEARNLTVAYPGGKALDDVSIRFERGRVHALAGENGAGKTTLIRVLFGGRAPERGTVLLDDEPVEFRNSAAAAAYGIRAVHQELQLFESLTVWENVTSGIPESGRLGVNRRAARQRASEALSQIGEVLPLGARVKTLAPAVQQRVAIARALADNVSFLILDEPTAMLSRPERDSLLNVVRQLADSGVGVIFVSHHLEETLRLADDVSVLRDGELVWTRLRRDVNEEELVTAMVGHAPHSYRKREAFDREVAPLLQVRNLRWGTGIHRLDLTVLAGEIVGIVGLPGSDAATLLSALVGASPRSGEVVFDGSPLAASIDDSITAGLGYVPADRKSSGLFVDMSLARNVSVATMKSFSRFGFMRDRRIVAAARDVVSRLDIRPAEPARLMSTLSGGNQQKGMIARWLVHPTRMLLAEEPTRGVDVATKQQIYETIESISASDGACVFYSSDLHEVVSVADRITVLRRDGSHVEVAGGKSADELYAVMSQVAA